MHDTALIHELIRQIPGAIFIGRRTADGLISVPYMSPALAAFFELTQEDISNDASPLFQRFNPDDLEKFLSLLQESARTGAPWEYEAQFILPVQGLKWRHAKATTFVQPDGDTYWYGITTDITDRKQCEMALYESEQRFKSMFSIHSAAMLLINPLTGAIVDANLAAGNLYGYTHEQLTAMNIDQLNTLDRPSIMQLCAEASQEKRNYFTFTHIVATGEHRSVEVYSTPIPLNQEVLLFSIIHDITERKRQEEIIRDCEAGYRHLFEAVSDAIIVVNCTTLTIINANSATGKLYGYSQSELIGMPCLQLTAYPEKGRRFFTMRLEHVDQGIHRKKDGTVFPVEISCGYYASSGMDLAVIVLRDTSEFRQTLHALNMSENRFSTVFKASPIPIAITNLETHRFIDVNDAMLKIYGIERDEFIGRTSLELDIWARPEEREQMFKIFESCGYVRNFETASRNRFGEEGTVSISLEPIEVDDTPCLLIMVIDITERKMAENELRRIHDELEQLILERTISLQKMNTRLLAEIEEGRQKQQTLLDYQHRLESMSLELSISEERERSRIAGELHDQVCQNLIVAKMRLAALADQNGSYDGKNTIDKIEQTIDQALTDIRSLTFQLRPPILANAGLESALEWLCEEFSRDFNIEFKTQDDGLPKVLVYEIRSIVFQVVRELMMNVVKHARATRADITLERVEDSLYITVSDDGIGANSDGETAVKEGFGIFNSRQKIEGLGGYFSITSRSDKGTGVTLGIPLNTFQEEGN